VVSLAVALGLAVLPVTGAQAEAPETTSITVALKRQYPGSTTLRPATYGVFYDTSGPFISEDTFRVVGRLTSDTTGEGIGGEVINLFRQLPSDDVFERVLSVRTDADGRYDIPQRVVGSARYGTTYEGNGDAVEGTSSATFPLLPAMRDFNARSRQVDGKVVLGGAIHPGWGGRTITLQRRTCSSCAWRSVAAKPAGSWGGWSFRVDRPSKAGVVWTWRAALAAGGNFDRSYSARLITRRGSVSLAPARPS
jgi:hypothetical protein